MVSAEKQEIRTILVPPERQRETLLQQMERFYPLVTARAASGTLKFILSLHNTHAGTPSKETMKEWKPLIDGVSKQIMADELNDIPIVTISVGSEGRKERLYTGEEAPSLQGEFGDGDPRHNFPIVWKVSDVVEGTDFAVANKPGASSVVAGTPPGGIKRTPENAYHMVKLIAPPQARGVMSLTKDHAENLHNLISVLGIKPAELTQVTLNPYKDGKLTRAVNVPFIEAAKKVGVNLIVIDAGDFVPGIRAGLDSKEYGKKYSPMIVVGRSGWEETTMDGAAIRALEEEAFMEAIEYNEDPRIMAKNPLWTARDLAPAPRESILVSTSFITDDNRWFNQPGVEQIGDKSHLVTTLVATHKGIEFRKIVLPS